jgi:hypothetical protein
MQLKTFRVKGFKNFRSEVVLEELGPINVIHGDNNVGKSNLVEAIGLLFLLLGEAFERGARYPHGMRGPDGGRDEDELPLLHTRSLPQARVQRLGFPASEIFHSGTPMPIEIAATLEVSHDELVKAGIEPPVAVASLFIVLELTRPVQALDALRLEVRDLRLGETDTDSLQADARMRDFVRQLGAYLSQDPTDPGLIVPRYAWITVDRSLSPKVEETGYIRDDDDNWPSTGRDLIPSDLCLKLHDARASDDARSYQRWELFVSVLKRFQRVMGDGELDVVYDRREDRARLWFRGTEGRLPAHVLGSGVQQIVGLIGRMIMSRAAILAIEEPELNLRYTVQLELREVLEHLVKDPAGPGQLFLTSHSPAFESSECFYAMRASDSGPVVERRPSTEAPQFTGHQVDTVPPSGKRAPLCYVSSEGLVLVPEDVRQRLGVEHGGGVFFLDREDTGHVEMLSNEQFLDLLEPVDEDESD